MLINLVNIERKTSSFLNRNLSRRVKANKAEEISAQMAAKYVHLCKMPTRQKKAQEKQASCAICNIQILI